MLPARWPGRPPLVVYDRPVPGTPTVVWLFPVVLTVCFRPFGPKVTLALFLFKFTRTPGAILMLRRKRKPIEKTSFSSVLLRFLVFSHLWDNIITGGVLLSTCTTHLWHKWQKRRRRVFENIQARRPVQYLRRARPRSQRAGRHLAGALAYKIQITGLDITQKAISRIETGDRIVADYELEYLADASA